MYWPSLYIYRICTRMVHFTSDGSSQKRQILELGALSGMAERVQFDLQQEHIDLPDLFFFSVRTQHILYTTKAYAHFAHFGRSGKQNRKQKKERKNKLKNFATQKWSEANRNILDTFSFHLFAVWFEYADKEWEYSIFFCLWRQL